MGWLVDNNVPRAVTILLRDRGQEAVEVRDVLGADASDPAIAALAVAQGHRVVTHDVDFARRCRASGLPHLWLRTREFEDHERLAAALPEVLEAFEAGALRVVITRRTLKAAR